MKNSVLISLLLPLATFGLMISFTSPGDEFTDLEKYRLKASIKSVMEIKYALPEEKGDESQAIIYQKFTGFDINGYEAETKVYQDGHVYLYSEYLFGPDNKQAEMNEYNPDGTLNLHVTYNYDEKKFRTSASYLWSENRKIGEIAEHTDYYYEIIQNDIFTNIRYKNDYRGFCLEENYLKSDSSLSFRFISKYDFRGNKLETGYFHGNGRLSWMTKYRYDRYDNMIESRVYKSNRIAVISKYDYLFDAAGNWIRRNESREVFTNILTAGLQKANTITERTIEYY